MSGRLCSVVDVRVPLACPATDLTGIDLTAGTATATTDDTGAFTLELAADADVVIGAVGGDDPVRAALFASEMWRDDDQVRAPIVKLTGWDPLLATIGAIEPDGTASIALYIEDQNGPIAGAEVLPPDGSQAPFYDNGAADAWDQGGLTSGFGAALIFAVPSLASSVQLVVAVDAGAFTVTVPVADDTLTFAHVVLDTSGT
jgi:hypothetical protein